MIDIILATYNGQAYLAEQIKSIQESIGYQKWVNKIIVTDDGSMDNTNSIVAQLAKKDSKINWVKNTSVMKGPKHNFAFGLTQSNADYVMLCDQDDIWLPHKIETSIERLLKAEKKSSPETPLLVFSDKQIVDEQLTMISDSYFRLKNIPKDWHVQFSQLCQQNVISGCTTLFNRALINKALPIPDQAYMHDWWLALVAHRCGEIHFIDTCLIQYRQHSNNTIGAKKRTLASLCLKFSTHFNAFKKSHLSVIKQAIAFQRFEQKAKLSPDTTINVLANLNESSRRKKISYFYQRKVTRSHFLGRVALLYLLLVS